MLIALRKRVFACVRCIIYVGGEHVLRIMNAVGSDSWCLVVEKRFNLPLMGGDVKWSWKKLFRLCVLYKFLGLSELEALKEMYKIESCFFCDENLDVD